MQLSLEGVKKREDPYQMFLDSLTNKETRRKYNNWLYQFLKLIPEDFFKHTGQAPMCQDVGTLARCFVDLAKKSPDLAKNIIAEFIKEEKKLAAENKLNPNTIPNHVKPIKSLLDANGIPIHWKSLHKMYPREQKNQDRAYTKEELQNLTQNDIEYIEKLDWLWNQLSAIQRSQIIYSVTKGIPSQQSSFHCFIGEAIRAKRIQVTSERKSLCGHIQSLAKTIFCDGPCYDDLLERKLSAEDQKKLNEIYYARIGIREHQDQRANKLIRIYVTSKLPACGT
jgi:hypothetical protein